jgi:hypothetical protein
MEFTHRGWLMFCPIYLKIDFDSEELNFAARHWSLIPLLWIAQAIDALKNWVGTTLSEDYEESTYFNVTGEL